MILSDDGIKKALRQRLIEIVPEPQESQYTTSAVDLHLGTRFKCWDEKTLGLAGAKTLLNLAEQRYPLTADVHLKPFPKERDGSYILPPYDESPSPVLALTLERVHLKLGSRLAARVEGRSSLARLGLVIHLTAPTIHAGWNGRITLEMINHGPFHLQLIPEETVICQLIFERLESPPLADIRTAFQQQTSPGGGKKRGKK